MESKVGANRDGMRIESRVDSFVTPFNKHLWVHRGLLTVQREGGGGCQIGRTGHNGLRRRRRKLEL